MESLEGVSFDVASRHVSRTILSSVGGFSQPARRNIRSLQDLLATIQRFGLQLFDSRILRHGAYIGEGVSYKVSRCQHTGSKQLYARKDVKLPQKSGDTGAFERQVACVLRDVEVMHALADRPNILDIFGYGWDIQSGNVIPFLVTELAVAGTLRQFLKTHQLALDEKLLLCKDVAHGLHSLHVIGVAHGDLKLDNVLVRPYVGVGDAPEEQERLRISGMQACISDFGHSLHLYDGEEDTTVTQRYGGTLAYNAPEILDKIRTSRSDLNFRKCDVWSLGLTCWEILIDGKAYYHSADVEGSILSSQRRSASIPTAPLSNPSSQASSGALLEELIHVTSQFAHIACKEISEKTAGLIESQDLSRLQYVFKRCLEPDHAQRIADIPLLPLFYGQGANVIPAARTDIRPGTSWSFELFEVARQIPNEVRRLIASDWEKMANEPGASVVSARASFQLGMAYVSGFGLVQDPNQALHWFSQSVLKGFRMAELYIPVLRLVDPKPFIWHHSCLLRYLDCNRAVFRELFSCLRTTFEDTAGIPENDSHDSYFQKLGQVADVDAPITNGETPITVAVKFGNLVATQSLIDRDARVNVIDSAGCNLLHWLFMFPDDDIPMIARTLLRPVIGTLSYSEQLVDKIPSISLDINHLAPIGHTLVADPQLPASLGGTPLAFAVSTYCTAAVKILLDLGADPLLGLKVPGQNIQMLSPICIAFRFHMADVLDSILQHIVDQGASESVLVHILDGLQECLPALPVERTLIHGRYLEYAAIETIKVLLSFYRQVGHPPRHWSLLKSAARCADIELCSAIQSCVEGMNDIILPRSQRNEIMLACTYSACEVGQDITISKQLFHFAMSNGCDINCNAYTAKIPLFIVADHKESELLDWMIHNFNVDLTAKDGKGNTILHHLALSSSLSTFNIYNLILKGADPTIRNWRFELPIDLVREEQDVQSLKILLNYTPPDPRRSFLRRAIRNNIPVMLKACIQSLEETAATSGAAGWSRRLRSGTIDAERLTEAESSGIHDSIRPLLDEGLSLAAEAASPEVIQILLDAGSDSYHIPHHSRSRGKVVFDTLLHRAARFGNAAVVRFCLKTGYNANSDTGSGPPLAIATWALVQAHYRVDGLRACCDALLDAGATTSFRSFDGDSPLAILLQSSRNRRDQHFDLIQRLLRQDCDPNEGTDKHMLTHLMETKDLRLAELLVSHGLSSNRASPEGDYPLHLSAKMKPVGRENIAQLSRLVSKLLQNGCNPLFENRHGVTPLELAVLEDNALITHLLIEHIFSNSLALESLPVQQFSSYQQRLFERPPRQLKRRNSVPNMIIHEYAAPKSVQDALAQAWGLAAFGNKFDTMEAFIWSGLHGLTTYLTRRKAIILLYYAMAHNSDRILREYMGGENENGSYEEPDEYLKAVWDSIRPYFATLYQPDDLLSVSKMLGIGPTEPLVGKKSPIQAFYDGIECFPLAEDLDIPVEFHKYFFHRFQYLSAIGHYSPVYPASHLVWYNFIETQQEPGMISVIVDQEAELRKQQHHALTSLLGPIGDEELAYVHLSAV